MSTLSISSYTSAASYLFSRIDTTGKGYINKDDLVSAFSSVTSTSESDVSDVFTQIDGDSDGKVTESEFSSALQALNSQYDASRMQGMPPPPPPPSGDAGFTEEELTSQLEEIGDTDSARSTLISSIVENFDAADTDQDGKVSHAEAMAYAQAKDIATKPSGHNSATNGAELASSASDAQVFQKMLELMRAYGIAGGDASTASVTSAISTVA